MIPVPNPATSSSHHIPPERSHLPIPIPHGRSSSPVASECPSPCHPPYRYHPNPNPISEPDTSPAHFQTQPPHLCPHRQPSTKIKDLHHVRAPSPKVIKNPQSHPNTLQLQANAKIAKQTYSPKRRNVAFCQDKVRYLISCASSSRANAANGSTSTSPSSIVFLESGPGPVWATWTFWAFTWGGRVLAR